LTNLEYNWLVNKFIQRISGIYSRWDSNVIGRKPDNQAYAGPLAFL